MSEKIEVLEDIYVVTSVARHGEIFYNRFEKEFDAKDKNNALTAYYNACGEMAKEPEEMLSGAWTKIVRRKTIKTIEITEEKIKSESL